MSKVTRILLGFYNTSPLVRRYPLLINRGSESTLRVKPSYGGLVGACQALTLSLGVFNTIDALPECAHCILNTKVPTSIHAHV